MNTDTTERAELLTRVSTLAQAANLPAISDGAALVERLNASGVSIHFHHHLDDNTVIAKLKAFSGDAALFEQAQKQSLTGPGPKLPDGFVEYLGGLYSDWLAGKVTGERKLAIWQSWCTRSGHEARIQNPLTPRAVAPVKGPTGNGQEFNVELSRLEARLAQHDRRPTPTGYAARRLHEAARQAIVDRIAGVRRRSK